MYLAPLVPYSWQRLDKPAICFDLQTRCCCSYLRRFPALARRRRIKAYRAVRTFTLRTLASADIFTMAPFSLCPYARFASTDTYSALQAAVVV
ncbi:hypothetical protein FKM82_031004 [Ascaphus truei]